MTKDKEKSEKPSNAPEVLIECFQLLETIEDKLLREVAMAIFAPLGTGVPRLENHHKAFYSLPQEVLVALHQRGGLAAAFRRDEQAYNVLLEAVNAIHKLYRTPPLKGDESIFGKLHLTSLLEALKAIGKGPHGLSRKPSKFTRR